MAAQKHIDVVCVVITVFTLLLTVLLMNGKALGAVAAVSEENGSAMFTENDLDGAWDAANATRITLSDAGSTVRGNGAYVNGGDVHIVYGGKYVLSGAISDGSVVIEADGDDKIWLLLDGVSIHCESDAAIRIEQAGKVFLTLGEGSENFLSSGASYEEEAVSAGVDGTIYSRDDLTINGTGSLSVTAAYGHGVVCNDDFVITGGTLGVTAVQDAIHANDSVRIKGADITLSAGDDGITVSNDEETSFIYVESGKIDIPSCYEGLEAVQITIAGGTLNIAPADDGINASGYGGSSVIYITGGDITITDENGRDADGIDSNKDIFISGGRLFISVSDSGGSCAIDCGSENGGVCEISGGTVLACGSSMMAEGFDASSSQGFLMYTVSAAAGTRVAVKDASGNELLSETVPCSFSSVLVSTPEMKVGDICTLVVGDAETEMTIDNSSSVGGRMQGGFGGGRMTGLGGFGDGQLPERRGGFGGGQVPGQGDVDGEQLPDQLGGFDGGQVPDQGDVDGGLLPGQSGGFDGEEPSVPVTAPVVSPQSAVDSESQSGDAGGQAQPNFNFPQDNGNFVGRQGERTMRGLNGTMQGQENISPAAAEGASVSAETLVLLGVSVLVLLVGCVIAAVM